MQTIKSIINYMPHYGFLALLINKCEPSYLGSHSLGFPPSWNLPPTITAMSPLMISTIHSSIVDLVKLDHVHVYFPLFTHDGASSSYYYDHFSHHEGFYSYFRNVCASLPIYSSPRCQKKKLIFLLAAC